MAAVSGGHTALIQCPEWDSNPHCMDFEAMDSYRLVYRGLGVRPANLGGAP